MCFSVLRGAVRTEAVDHLFADARDLRVAFYGVGSEHRVGRTLVRLQHASGHHDSGWLVPLLRGLFVCLLGLGKNLSGCLAVWRRLALELFQQNRRQFGAHTHTHTHTHTALSLPSQFASLAYARLSCFPTDLCLPPSLISLPLAHHVFCVSTSLRPGWCVCCVWCG